MDSELNLNFHSKSLYPVNEMGSKTVILLGLFLAIVLVITSEVTARDLAETSTSLETTEAAKQTNGLNDAKYGGGYGGGPGGGYGGGPGGGYGGGPGGGYGGGPGGGYGGGPGGGYRGGNRGGGYCRYNCCRRGYNGGCFRCCSYEGEPMDKGN